MLCHATAKNGVLELLGTLPKEVRRTRPILPQRYPLRGAGNQRPEQVKKREKKRLFCSMGSGKTNILGFIRANPKRYQSPPPVRGGRYVPRRGRRPRTIRTAKPPNFGQEKPAKTCGHAFRGLFRASGNGNFSRRKSKSGRISPPTPL